MTGLSGIKGVFLRGFIPAAEAETEKGIEVVKIAGGSREQVRPAQETPFNSR
jgi:hypothetical protein